MGPSCHSSRKAVPKPWPRRDIEFWLWLWLPSPLIAHHGGLTYGPVACRAGPKHIKTPSFHPSVSSSSPATQQLLLFAISILTLDRTNMFSTQCTPVASQSSSTATSSRASTSTPITNLHVSDMSSSVNHNAPQCCHCGWRGAHAPTCPFK